MEVRSLFDVVVVVEVAKVHAVDAAPTNRASDNNDFIVCCCVMLCCCIMWCCVCDVM